METPENKNDPVYQSIKLGPLMIIAVILMLVGLVISFFHHHLGGGLVGLSLGLVFNVELQRIIVRARKYYIDDGLFRTLILLGTILYLLIAAPLFLIGIVVGFIVMTLFRYIKNGSI